MGGGEYMNRNLIIFIVVVLVLVGGYSLVKSKNQSSTTAPVPSTQTQNPTTAPSAMEKSPSTEPEAMSQKEDTVTLSAEGFTPATITVKKGDKVVWINKSGDSATVDSNNHPSHLLYPPLNLGSFNDGEKHELVFDKAGSYGYHDHFHPSRKGTVVVE